MSDITIIEIGVPSAIATIEIATGIIGPIGETGDTGPAGDSAYEVAVSNGFVGTEEEWLEYLAAGGTWDELEGKPSTFPPSAHTHAIADVTGLQAALDGKELVGAAAVALQAAEDYADQAIATVLDSSPEALNTLNELAAALGDDPNFATTITTSIGLKEATANKDTSGGYAGLTLFKLNLKNALGTVTSWFTTAATTARTWTMPDKDGTVAMLSDIVPAGADTQVQFNDGGTFAGDSGMVWNKTANVLTIGGQLIADNAVISTTGATIIDLQRAGTSKFKVDEWGEITGPTKMDFGVGFQLTNAGATIHSGGGIKFTSNTTAQAADVALMRNAAGVVEVNSGTAGDLRNLKLRQLNAGGVVTHRLADTSGTIVCTPSASGGSLASATYYVQVVALDANGLPNNSSNTQGSAAVTGPTGSIAISWTAVPNASSYRVCIGTSSYGQSYYFPVAGNLTSYAFTTTAGAVAQGGTSAMNTTGTIWPAGSGMGIIPHTNTDLVFGIPNSSAYARITPYSGSAGGATGIVLASNMVLGWPANGGATNSMDMGIIRSAANTLAITDSGTTNFRDLKLRNIEFTGGSVVAPSLSILGAAGGSTAFGFNAANGWASFGKVGTPFIEFGSDTWRGANRVVNLVSTAGISWSSTTGVAGTEDLGLSREAAGVLALTNGASSPAYRDLKLRGLTATGPIVVIPDALTSSANITIDATLGNNFKLVLAHNTTLENPTGLVDGQVLNIRIKQDATGSRTLAFGSKFKFPGGVAPVASTAIGAVDFMSAYYDATDDRLECVYSKDFA